MEVSGGQVKPDYFCTKGLTMEWQDVEGGGRRVGAGWRVRGHIQTLSSSNMAAPTHSQRMGCGDRAQTNTNHRLFK